MGRHWANATLARLAPGRLLSGTGAVFKVTSLRISVRFQIRLFLPLRVEGGR